MSESMKINYLPAPTWNWLKMNVATAERPADLAAAAADIEAPEGVNLYTAADFLKGTKTGMGEEPAVLLDKAGVQYTVVRSEGRGSGAAPVRIGFDFSATGNSCGRIGLEAGDGDTLFAIMDFAGADAKGTSVIQTKVGVGKDALVRLIQIQHFGEELTFFNDIGAECGENGRFELVQIVLGGKATFLGVHTQLSGNQGSFKSDLGYLLENDDRLDLNFTASHLGKKTDSKISVNGVLRDRAFKLFRGTIDFKNGSAGATGDEKEDVLLLSDGVVNQTIPLILCAEEDVEGGHGATIGRVDEDLLFYLESRGIPEDAVYEMLATARIDAVAGLIGDEKAKALVRDCIGVEDAGDE